MADDLDRELGIRELRRAFLRYTRLAHDSLPPLSRPRILDIGCGWGAATLELARLGDGQIVGIDPDVEALADLRREILRLGLADRVSAVEGSLLESGFPDESFDLLWDEGALHLLPPVASLRECRRLLTPGGFLVSGETRDWFDRMESSLADAGFEAVTRIAWEKGCWWREFYEPLQRRLERLRTRIEARSGDLGALGRYEREIESVRNDPEASETAHVVMRLVS